MNLRFSPIPVLTLFLTLIVAPGCDGGGDDGEGDGGNDESNSGDPLPTGEGPCEASSDCEGDVCVAIVDGDHPPVYCTQPCGSGCPDGFYCDDSTFGLVGLDFCRFGDPPAAGEPPANEEPPRLPCKEDADCDDGQVCGTFMGESDCTIVCGAEDDCTPPAVGGITLDVSTCAPDETSGQDRSICVPDLDCYPNVLSCISGLP